MSSGSAAAAPALNPTQRHVFDELLEVSDVSSRPVARPGMVDELRHAIDEGTRQAVASWTEPTMFLGKSQLMSVLRCEGQAKADAEQPRDGQPLHPATVVGIAAHKAIQIAHTHPDGTVGDHVEAAVRSARSTERRFREFWDNVGVGEQSDLIAQVTSKVNGFLSSWPPLSRKWEPRFEESVQARVGGLKLSARVDLVLGNPRPTGEQTMLLTDIKTGSIGPRHDDEAGFYALVSTLRHGVPPFKSLVYSVASGEWSEAAVTEPRLWKAARQVVTAVNALAEVLGEHRDPVLTGGRWCEWCPLAKSCPASQAEAAGEE